MPRESRAAAAIRARRDTPSLSPVRVRWNRCSRLSSRSSVETECGRFLSVDKPCGPSSFAVVAAVREALCGVKAGHAGTLDPAASGLLVLAAGSATRLLPFLPLEPKRYRFGVQFGVQTDTLDSEGRVIRDGGIIPEPGAIEAVLPRFSGTLSQIPPEYSAVKIDGVRSYRLARAGVRRRWLRNIKIFSRRSAAV
ncbi:MAG: hypothetical protein MZV70_77280 [Desulfobacterales bacterium]|nr:hypothetical protein [Desulfobacterales bacterium]